MLPSASSLLAVSLLLSPVANAGFIFFDDRAEFEAASGLSGINEDFEEGNVSAGGVSGTTNPLNSFTNDSTFSTGDIVSGLTVSSSNGAVVAVGAGLLGDSIGVGADLFSATTSISFDSGFSAIGLDLFSNNNNDTFDISLLSFGGLAIGGTAISGLGSALSFFGVISDDTLITRLDFDSQNGAGEIIDNVTFGNVRVDVPEPSSLILLTLGLAGIGFSRRKNNKYNGLITEVVFTLATLTALTVYCDKSLVSKKHGPIK